MSNNQTFLKLKSILQQYENQLSIVHDKEDNYYLNTPLNSDKKKPEFFGAVQVKKSYVAFHIMPIYYYPNLLQSISPKLKSCMQGKSCFNFKDIEDDFVNELNELVKQSFELYKHEKKI